MKSHLEINKISFEISVKIWKIVITWTKFERNTIGSQLVRTIDSVGANLSEVYGGGKILITLDLLRLLEAPYLRLNIGLL